MVQAASKARLFDYLKLFLSLKRDGLRPLPLFPIERSQSEREHVSVGEPIEDPTWDTTDRVSRTEYKVQRMDRWIDVGYRRLEETPLQLKRRVE